ncbi:MAG: suppressor of fused domain protein [Planctomycetaceae bacterium]|nr:suppressor of fused domain protein [Planctomycetaceae bacterium]
MSIIVRCHECEKRYRVPDDRAGKRIQCRECKTILFVPSVEEEQPKAEDGTAILRHEHRNREFELATGDEQNIEIITAHIEETVGKVEMVFHEIISDIVHIDVHWVKPTRKRPFHTLITSGMSDRPMVAPDPCREFEYAELCVNLPADWKISQKAFSSEENYWPIRLLKFLARLPHEFETWLGIGHTVPNGDPAEPYADNTRFSCALLLPPLSLSEEFHCLECEDRKIWFYNVVPLYEEETNYKLSKGLEALVDRFEKHSVSDIIDINRPNTCKKKWFGLF